MSVTSVCPIASTSSQTSNSSEINNAMLIIRERKDDQLSHKLLSAVCPKDTTKGFLQPVYFVLDNGLVFTDKLLLDPNESLMPGITSFTNDYYKQLHSDVSKFNTYNHLGARIPLKHSNLNVQKFRELLPPNYDDAVVLQYLEYGFPLGLKEDFILSPVLSNHSSAYEYYTYVDKFV